MQVKTSILPLRELDCHWCADYTKVGPVRVLVVIELSTRLVLGHQIRLLDRDAKGKEIPCTIEEDASNLVFLFEEIVKQRRTSPIVFHSDCAKVFTKGEFSDCLKNYNTEQSFASEYRFQNQVVERWHRTFKYRVRSVLESRFANKSFESLKSLNCAEIEKLFNEIVEHYNDSPHRHLKGISPTVQEESLLLTSSQESHPPTTPLALDTNGLIDMSKLFKDSNGNIIAALSSEPAARAIEKFKWDSAQSFNSHWSQYVRALAGYFDAKLNTIQDTVYETSETTQKKIVKTVVEESNRVINSQSLKISNLEKQLGEQESQLKEQEKILKFLNEEELARKLSQQRTVERREHLKNRSRLPLRDPAAYPELMCALDYVDKAAYLSEFACSRDLVSLLILFFTGLRISNLLLLRSKDLSLLLAPDRDMLTVPVIKTGSTRQQLCIYLDETCFELANRYREDIELLQKGKNDNDLVFTAEGSATSVSRAWFNERLNRVLKATGKKFNKNLKSHSFRVAQINSYISAFGIEQAKDLIGHKNISTTSKYARGYTNSRALLENMKKVSKMKKKGLPRTPKRIPSSQMAVKLGVSKKESQRETQNIKT